MAEILIADDDDAIRLVLGRAFEDAAHTVQNTASALTLLEWIKAGRGDAVLLDVIMPDVGGFDILPEIRQLRPELPVIIMSAQSTLSTAVKATEYGAYDYVPKPFDLAEVISSVNRALEQASTTEHKRDTVEGVEDLIVGRSAAMQSVYRLIARLSQSDLRVLVHGESGTGKELVAKALHAYGLRANKPFIAVNMGAVPSDLIESELFGHEKGAFTGAITRKTGRFEQAEGGTLFLDEIGDMPLGAQTRLLRVLQENEYTPLGGLKPQKSDVRIIAATHQPLEKLVSQGAFREDLYYRLNVVPLALPALRDRREDIPDLVQHFLKNMTNNNNQPSLIEPEAMAYLKDYHWPGNIRELENFLNRLTLVYPDGRITLSCIIDALKVKHAKHLPEIDYNDLSDHYLKTFEAYLNTLFKEGLPAPGLYQNLLVAWETCLFDRVLKATGNNQIKAAEILGINRNTLRKKRIEQENRNITTGPYDETS